MAPGRPFRKRYIIKPGYQLKIAAIISGAFILYSVLLAFILLYPLFGELYNRANPEEQVRAAEIVLYLHKRLWPAILAIAILVGVHVVIVSHRLFGPVYRFEETLRSFLKGDFSGTVKLRRHDSLKETAELFNQVAARLDEKERRDRALRLSIKDDLEGCVRLLVEGGGQEEVRKRIESAIARINGGG